MRLIIQEGSTCFITSVAMVLDLEVQEVRDYLGHDNAPHYQEFYPLFKSKGVIPSYQVITATIPCHTPQDQTPREVYFGEADLKGKHAILFTDSHAVAWDGSCVYDPQGKILPLQHYNIVDYILLI